MQAIGLMSGTSLDGLDICCCTFTRQDDRWTYSIDAAKGYCYPDELRKKLGTTAQDMNAKEFVVFHSEYGRYLGKCVNEFIQEFLVRPDIIASHGHTIFHEPHRQLMFQIGDGAAIAAETGISTVSDFRRLDIMLGGEGAPLVPIGDRLLFGDYGYCLNIGGFSNISFEEYGQRMAFDICPVNYVINYYCRIELERDFDSNGETARSGQICMPLLEELDGIEYYHTEGPKSLGREWVESNIYPLMARYTISIEDKLRTYYEHVARQVAHVVQAHPQAAGRDTMLVTGGGAFNSFLIERIADLCRCRLSIPERNLIEYKEAVIFAFLGTLYMAGESGCLSSVTGASKDNIGGMLFKI